MKIGIVTINDPNPNYGNRLQNYAVDRVLKNLGADTTTLYVENQHSLSQWLKHFIHIITFYKFKKNAEFYHLVITKKNKFLKFNDAHIRCRHIKSFSSLKSQYDFFVIGSDQVWNPSWFDDKKKEAYLLTFADPEQKICFSPSFGIDELPPKWEPHFKNSLMSFNTLSVREEAGAEIIYKLTKKQAQVLIDPTLMLSKDEWLNISSKPLNISFDKKYIFTYFIGEKSEYADSYINKIAASNNMNIYNLLDPAFPELFICDPSEFIYLISNASLVFTDSFHACVFSFIFTKPFCVFERQGNTKNMMSRINTLLKTFDLERKLYNEDMDIFENDYSKGYHILAEEQNKVLKYLKDSLNI